MYLKLVIFSYAIQPNMVLVTLSFLFSASSSDTIQSMRYANSLESLDAVSTSIQQGTIHILRKPFLSFLVAPPSLTVSFVRKCVSIFKSPNVQRKNYSKKLSQDWILNFMSRIVFLEYFFFGDLEIWKTNRIFWKKATFTEM